MNKEFLDYVRHLSKQDTKTLSQKALKTTEEVGELARVVLPYDNAFGTTHRFIEREKILEESVDVILTAISIAYDLNFTDDEIDEMLARKAEKWAQRQAKETDLEYPLPYEIHVTVNLKGVDGEIEVFRNKCADIGVKPIILDLQNSGKSVMTDVMTSSKHFGDNRSALTEATRIATELKNGEFNVVRVKIETVPWHPAAPQHTTDTMPPNCYFESHIPVILTKEDELSGLQKVCADLEMHLSRNIFKRNEDGTFVIMATRRLTTGTKSAFQENIDLIRKDLESKHYTIGSAITEFSVYDTKVSHDASWISKS